MQHNGDQSFVDAIVGNAHRYEELFAETIDVLLKDIVPDDSTIRSEDIADVLLKHRMQQAAASRAENADGNDADAEPPSLPTRLVRRCVGPVTTHIPTHSPPSPHPPTHICACKGVCAHPPWPLPHACRAVAGSR